jgi:regulatory protein YycI of two-component signal transduction system YycFG
MQQNPISVLLFSCNATRQLVERIRERKRAISYMQSTLTHGDNGAMQIVTGEDKVLQKSLAISLTCTSVSF